MQNRFGTMSCQNRFLYHIYFSFNEVNDNIYCNGIRRGAIVVKNGINDFIVNLNLQYVVLTVALQSKEEPLLLDH